MRKLTRVDFILVCHLLYKKVSHMSFVFRFVFSEADLRHAEVGRGRELPSPLATVWVGNDQALPTPQQDA